MKEQIASFQDYARHPDFAPGQKYLIDLRQITGFDGDYLGAMKLLAEVGESIPRTETSVMFVYLGDTDPARKLCHTAVNTLSATDGIVACFAETEQEALEILGLPATRLNALKRAYC